MVSSSTIYESQIEMTNKKMQLFQPQLQLVKRSYMDEDPDYFLHVVTICDRTNYREDGLDSPSGLNADGDYEVNLSIKQELDLPDHAYFTPVVHSISLGKLPFGMEEGNILVSVYVNSLEGSRGDSDKPKNQSSTSNTSADEEDRPFTTAKCPVFPFK